MHIAILDDYQDAVRKLDCYALLADHPVKIFNNTVKGTGQLAIRLADTEALVLIRERTRIGKDLLLRLPKLKIISQTGNVAAGSMVHIDMATCKANGIAVAVSHSAGTATAELTWALTLAGMRRLPQYIANLKHGVWQQSGLKSALAPANHGLGETLLNKTLGIWGYGKIGQQVAKYGVAFGMRVVVWGSETSRAKALDQGLEVAKSKAEFFAGVDVLSIHLRLAEETRGIVELADLQAMKSTALFVNTSRAELIAPDALIKALNGGRPGLAAVDVFETEPLLAGQPLLRMENVICTPHLGYVEKDNYERLFAEAFRNILAFAEGYPQNLVNPEVLKTARQA